MTASWNKGSEIKAGTRQEPDCHAPHGDVERPVGDDAGAGRAVFGEEWQRGAEVAKVEDRPRPLAARQRRDLPQGHCVVVEA